MLNEDTYVTYAVGKDQISALGLKSIGEVPRTEEPACVVQELGYLLPYNNNQIVDPLSLTLMLSAGDLEDPRVKKCVDEMLEELVW